MRFFGKLYLIVREVPFQRETPPYISLLCDMRGKEGKVLSICSKTNKSLQTSIAAAESYSICSEKTLKRVVLLKAKKNAVRPCLPRHSRHSLGKARKGLQ